MVYSCTCEQDHINRVHGHLAGQLLRGTKWEGRNLSGEVAAAVTCVICAALLTENRELENCNECQLVALLEKMVQQLETHLAKLRHSGEDKVSPGRVEWIILEQQQSGGGECLWEENICQKSFKSVIDTGRI